MLLGDLFDELHPLAGDVHLVVAIVAVELMPNALDDLAGWWVALAFSLGGLAYVVVETVVGRLQRKQDSGDRSRMWMIYAAVAVDLTSDGLMIGQPPVSVRLKLSRVS